ncbi:hypothetical protein Efla_004666 [Eimeria flavescens]
MTAAAAAAGEPRAAAAAGPPAAAAAAAAAARSAEAAAAAAAAAPDGEAAAASPAAGKVRVAAFTELTEDVFQMARPPVSLCFSLLLPAAAATAAIQLLNAEAPLSSPVPQVAFWPPLQQQQHQKLNGEPQGVEDQQGQQQQQQQQQLVQQQLGVYVPEWRRCLSFQHLKRCRTVKQTKQALLLVGPSPRLTDAVVRFLLTVSPLDPTAAAAAAAAATAAAPAAAVTPSSAGAAAVKDACFAEARAAADAAAAKGEAVVTAVHARAAAAGNVSADPAAAARAAAAAATGDAAAGEQSEALAAAAGEAKGQAEGGPHVLWRTSLWGDLLLLLLAVPAVAPQLQQQQQPWSLVWPCFFNRKRPAAAAAAAAVDDSPLETVDPSASERNTAVAPVKMDQQQQETHAALLQCAVERNSCLVVFHRCGAELPGCTSRSNCSSSSSSSKSSRKKSRSAEGDGLCSTPKTGLTATSGATTDAAAAAQDAATMARGAGRPPAAAAQTPVEFALCGCPIIGCASGPSCADFLADFSSRSSSSSTEGIIGHPLRHPTLVAVEEVSFKLLHEQKLQQQKEQQQQKQQPQQQEKQQQQTREISEGNYYCQGTCVYTPTEPCIMCCMGLLHSRISCLFFKDALQAGGGITAAALNRDRRLNHPFRVFVAR